MMKNITLKVACIHHPPDIFLNETSKGVWKLTGGIDAYVINILKEKFNFEYEVVRPVEHDWGRLIEGRWTGVIGMTNRNEVDLGISNMMISEKTFESVMFSVPYNSDGWIMVSLAPRYSENQHAVVQPFKMEVWCALFMSVLISTCVLFTMQFIRSRYKWTPNLTWRNTLWTVVAVLCTEGVKMKKIQGPGMVYFIVWIFATMILQISYGGTLIGFLTFPTMEPSITTLSDLAFAIRNKDVKFSYIKYSLSEKHLTGHVKYGELFTECILRDPGSQVSTILEGFQKVLRGETVVVILTEFEGIYDSYRVDFTKLQMSNILNMDYTGIVFSRKFQYFKDFNRILRRLTERGLIYKWRSDILFRRLVTSVFEENVTDREDEDATVSETIALKINHLRAAFLFLIIGHLLGIVTVMAEIFIPNIFN